MEKLTNEKQYKEEAYEYIKTEFEILNKLIDNKQNLYHCMVNGDLLDDLYAKIGFTARISCACEGNPCKPKWHKHFILVTSLKQKALNQRVRRYLTTLSKLDAPKEFYSFHKRIQSTLHLAATILNIQCHGRIGNHKHFNCVPYSLTTLWRRDLYHKFVNEYRMRDLLKTYIAKRGFPKRSKEEEFSLS
jgi:hypothetical protein